MTKYFSSGPGADPDFVMHGDQDCHCPPLYQHLHDDVTATLPSGEIDATHQWFLKNQYTWLRWGGKSRARSGHAEIPLEFRGQRLYIAWPPLKPSGSFVVFERVKP